MLNLVSASLYISLSLFDGGRVMGLLLFGVAMETRPGESPYGPFGDGARVNDNGRLVSMGFLRAWTINSTLVLLTHQHVDNAINGASSYLGVIKQVMDVPDQVPRCWWWPQNNGLYVEMCVQTLQHGTLLQF